ncbi:MAG: 2-polyprenyl-3-methyl-6-methoxy-1,4-benzoquinone monooxygenase [Candidatus Thiodiazotropha sp. (ex Ctena orbiculata)]|uniref:3-demethoxyubiquinol 3-hydroxylase n=1 Tax=Candidatus Thiodiazotropha taylori TaxID=2792791 RepID=A0A944QT50_9GAMM|nr:2-polyprenyl-3-methyl-6-methoxy-1,4-benzoquinone monooxygenase [Candidatus Thiodiazotropha taylori]PUB82634.1 MAG: demethoxyubiquinone hydroxylase family protein [gamma proteobacterium symbiont of Ctena orbiculata]MBT2987589.1 2-polyprenyl-3-methyl-6-methoxy-1,4-benzoquinone monooxygenase [Candidatus Thiodiazotropha taylori]MBT2995155.1 2-polyprenyl-3-methyl-6-methoxy-1,4-benzoquinone monooxygenase [Candidatus Thiodiazotropha taylori]MBT2999926.1 2-polyprenyl-3-methyl-6-methoxy-1,4-benzoquin
MSMHRLNSADRMLIGFDTALRTLFGRPQVTERANPADRVEDAEMSEVERDLAARLMRINHTGEVCAQALYQGQALTAKLPEIRDSMERAAREENDHLAWCENRLDELDNRKSLLNPFWYAGSFLIGATAGLAGDRWSLGFVAETEHQVEAHLNDHLGRIPIQDRKSIAILEQMKEDEIHHATVALEAGGAVLPAVIKSAMKLTSKLMTKSVYYL